MTNRLHSNLKMPSLRSAKGSLYMQAPPQLKAATRSNLERQLVDLVEEGEEIIITDAKIPLSLRITVSWEDSDETI